MYHLLVAADAAEWRDRVGVAGPVDGSAKPTTRLLASRGWVAKTSIDLALGSAEAARILAESMRARGAASNVWHPRKEWVVIETALGWLPITLCPELVTFRRFVELDDRQTAWIDLIRMGLDTYARHGLGLDLNPANFGSDGARGFYLDDEFYDSLSERNVANAVVARMPEEPEMSAREWWSWGARLAGAIALGDLSWERIKDEIRAYPLAERYAARRAALLDSLPDDRRPRAAPAPTLTCVIADVHANLPALDAVLRDARAQGVDSYLFLGDAVGYGPHPAPCVRRLAELPRAMHVRGNHDHAIASGKLELGMNSLARACAAWTRSQLGPSEIGWLAGLPVEHAGDGWMAVHGAPRDPHRFLAYVYELTYEENLRCLRDRRVSVCFYGHTHVQLVHAELAAGSAKLPGPRRLALDGKHHYLVNPGSVGQPRDGDPRASYALWNRDTNEIETRRVSYDVDATVQAVRSAGLPEALVERLHAGK